MQLANYPTFVASPTRSPSRARCSSTSRALIMPFASSVELLKDNKAQAGLIYTQLAQSSNALVAADGLLPVRPDGGSSSPATTRVRFALGYTAKGKFKSFFAGKPYPNEKGEKVTPTPNASLPPDAEKPIDEAQSPGRILIIGTRADAERHVHRRRVALRAGLSDRPGVRAQRRGLAGAGQGAVVDPRQGNHANGRSPTAPIRRR